MGTYEGRRHRRRIGAGPSGGPVRPIFGDAFISGKPDYKTAALCKQVRRALALALSGECGDPVLQDLIVEEVLPAPNAGRLLARVRFRARAGAPSVVDLYQRLGAVEKMLRASVAQAIARKRAPELAFELIPWVQSAASDQGAEVPDA